MSGSDWRSEAALSSSQERLARCSKTRHLAIRLYTAAFTLPSSRFTGGAATVLLPYKLQTCLTISGGFYSYRTMHRHRSTRVVIVTWCYISPSNLSYKLFFCHHGLFLTQKMPIDTVILDLHTTFDYEKLRSLACYYMTSPCARLPDCSAAPPAARPPVR